MPDRSAELSHFWSMDQSSLAEKLNSSALGLTFGEARRRVLGVKQLRGQACGDWRLLLGQFTSPLVSMLIVAGALSIAVGSAEDAAVILGIVLLSGLLGFFQERGARRVVERLLKSVQVRVEVLRDGAACELPMESVVAGDVVLLSAGSLVPADAMVLESKDLFVDEAALTGETFPVEKQPGQVPREAAQGARSNAVFLGTHVVSGTGKALVVQAGRDTEFGQIAGRVQARAPLTGFEIGVRQFGFLLVRVTALLVILVFALNVYLQRPVLESFLFSLALAVGLVPELLPAVVTVTLSQGARRMARDNVVVKRLPAIENLGSMNVLCSDKTGTLTEGRMQLEASLSADGAPSDEVLKLAAANSAFETGFANPVDELLRRTCPVDAAEFARLDEIPYDFNRKRLSMLVRRRGAPLLITKGALAQVLAVCSRARLHHGDVPMEQAREAVEQLAGGLGRKGLRVLGVAVRELPGRNGVHKADETDMTFLGLLAFIDPPKPGITETLARLHALGVRLKLITGDNRLVAASLAERVGISTSRILTGPELREMSGEALGEQVKQADVFAEIEPNQKERIILALKMAGFCVGYLGDGINDAPALHAADVGISVDGAVDVAKEAADIVLLNRDLDELIEGVRQGRRTFINTLKYIYITSSANFGNMLSMACAAIFLPFLPLLPKQILLNNFLSDFPAMTIGGDSVDAEALERPRRWDVRQIRNFMLVFGAVSSVFDFLTFWTLLFVFRAGEAEFRGGWFLESLLSELAILLVIRSRRPFFKSRPSRMMQVSTLLVALGSLALPYTPLGAVFALSPLPWPMLAALLGITLGYAALSELTKHWFFRREAQRLNVAGSTQ